MTDAGALRTEPWRDYAWVVIVLLLFVPLQILALLVASLISSTLLIGDPEREHFALVNTLLGGVLMLVAVPATGRLFGHRVALWAGWAFAVPILLAAASAYVFFEDVRSGLNFETDHALPEIFIPYAVVLLATAAIGNHLASAGPARQAWASVVWATAATTVVLIGPTALKRATSGGDFALDSALTVLMLLAVGAYTVVAVRTAR